MKVLKLWKTCCGPNHFICTFSNLYFSDTVQCEYQFPLGGIILYNRESSMTWRFQIVTTWNAWQLVGNFLDDKSLNSLQGLKFLTFCIRIFLLLPYYSCKNSLFFTFAKLVLEVQWNKSFWHFFWFLLFSIKVFLLATNIPSHYILHHLSPSFFCAFLISPVCSPLLRLSFIFTRKRLHTKKSKFSPLSAKITNKFVLFNAPLK